MGDLTWKMGKLGRLFPNLFNEPNYHSKVSWEVWHQSSFVKGLTSDQWWVVVELKCLRSSVMMLTSWPTMNYPFCQIQITQCSVLWKSTIKRRYHAYFSVKSTHFKCNFFLAKTLIWRKKACKIRKFANTFLAKISWK